MGGVSRLVTVLAAVAVACGGGDGDNGAAACNDTWERAAPCVRLDPPSPQLVRPGMPWWVPPHTSEIEIEGLVHASIIGEPLTLTDASGDSTVFAAPDGALSVAAVVRADGHPTMVCLHAPTCERRSTTSCALVEIHNDLDFSIANQGNVVAEDVESLIVHGSVSGQPDNIEAGGIVGTLDLDGHYTIPDVLLNPGLNVIPVRASWPSGVERERSLVVGRGFLPALRLEVALSDELPIELRHYQRASLEAPPVSEQTDRDLCWSTCLGFEEREFMAYWYRLVGDSGEELFRAQLPEPSWYSTEHVPCAEWVSWTQLSFVVPALPRAAAIEIIDDSGYGLGAATL